MCLFLKNQLKQEFWLSNLSIFIWEKMTNPKLEIIREINRFRQVTYEI